MKSNFYAPARACILAILLIISSSITEVYAQQFLTKIDGWNAYVHLPDDYNDSVGKRYPLICFIPGIGECGTDASKLLIYGPSKFVASGHNMQFMVNGKLEKPIVISLQPVDRWPGAWTINRKLDSVLARYRCDLQRINVTGLSMGGWSWDNYVDGYDPAFTNRITSIVSLSAPPVDNTVSNMRLYALAGGTLWGFEGNMDQHGLDEVVDTMNAYVAGSGRYTVYSGGHCCWNTFYNPTWVDNGESIYTWMLKQRKALVFSGPSAPQANAGTDSSISSVSFNFPLKGDGNDPMGLPINFNWTKIAGPTAGVITNPTVLQTGVTGLVYGTYKFELKVSNSLGLIGKDTITFINGERVLPIVLLDFNAKAINKNAILLQWKTNSEINSDYFVVEKSTNLQTFLEEGSRIKAMGANSLGATYSLMDEFPENGINYYRLKMVDKDGQVAYSKVVSVKLKGSFDFSIAISSVSVKNNQLQLNVNSLKKQSVTLTIVDALGKKIYSTNLSLNEGSNNFSRYSYLPKGIFYANFNTGKERITKAFIKE